MVSETNQVTASTSGMTVYAGTAGQAVWRSRDGGESFTRAASGMFIEAQVRALSVHPQNQNLLYAGTDMGLYRTDNGGDEWQRIPGPFDPGAGWPGGVVIWSLLVDPKKPERLFVGTCPPAVYRSDDSGASWAKLPLDLTPECAPLIYSRVTCIVADPGANPDTENTVWVGVEVDGLWRSQDGGDSWQRVASGLSSQDVHALAFLPPFSPGEPRRLFCATNNDLNLSLDEGEMWQPQNVGQQFPHTYCRGLQVKSGDTATLFLGNGNGPPGDTGTLQITRDGGQSWERADLPVAPNSTVWTFATHPQTPDLIFAVTVNGYLYRSEDGGSTWAKCRHEFGEVRCLACTA